MGGVAHPCLPQKMRAVWHYRANVYQGIGSSDDVECKALVKKILNIAKPCNAPDSSEDKATGGRCTFGGAWGGPGLSTRKDQRLLLASFFYLKLREADVLKDGVMQQWTTLREIESAADQACQIKTSADTLLSKIPTTP